MNFFDNNEYFKNGSLDRFIKTAASKSRKNKTYDWQNKTTAY